MDQMTGGLVMIAVGLLCVVGALLNWGVVVGPGKLIPRLLGPAGARIFMIVIGLVLVGLGLALSLGMMPG
jgi:hypothetical protein